MWWIRENFDQITFLAAFELSTRIGAGESEKYEILEKELLQPLNQLCLSTNKYTQANI